MKFYTLNKILLFESNTLINPRIYLILKGE